jgi:regulatory protein YycI of two-component signal transduction system YycFG
VEHTVQIPIPVYDDYRKFFAKEVCTGELFKFSKFPKDKIEKIFAFQSKDLKFLSTAAFLTILK